MGVWLSDDEAWEYVEGSQTGSVTTRRRDGFPVTLPVWFVVIDREVYVRYPAHGKKVLRIKHDGRAAFLVESGSHWRELKAVSFTVAASIVHDPWLRATALAMLGDGYRHLRVSRANLPEPTARHCAAKAAIIRLTPQGRLFSALTYNAHRIHYDRDYARDVEGHPGLLAHGPLQALAIAEAARALVDGSDPPVVSFEYRLLSPLFDHQGMIAKAVHGQKGAIPSVRDSYGWQTVRGTLRSTDR